MLNTDPAIRGCWNHRFRCPPFWLVVTSLDNWYLPVRWGAHIAFTHCTDVKMSAMASQITCVSIVCSAVCSGANQRKHQSSASLAFVTDGFPSQRASHEENISIWWRYHVNSPDISKAACVRRNRCWRTMREVLRSMMTTIISSHSTFVCLGRLFVA